ncbi:hypothetical protein [Novosphingobium sp. FSW06-99]|uniref:hypothetical protein n=1 Tax=Novosphingobium sp. FSW06-99 TaxID=1739113 RepID=UPI00076D0080|nr:hypothetical protein AQZ49_02570 [Novosphingobium sp. FSW06-99]
MIGDQDLHVIAAKRGEWGVLIIIDGVEMHLPARRVPAFLGAVEGALLVAKGEHAAQVGP